MATFVLVHGAWHGGWCWGRVAKLLRAEGHDVYTPTLTGLADRSHLMAPTINLSTHVRDITNLITWEGLSMSSSAIPMAAWSSPASPKRSPSAWPPTW